ncbi:MAG: histidine kinase [Prevotella sp.]|nr:histidine kinase [Prevotella sp.]
MRKALRNNKENLIYIGFWILLFLAPLLTFYIQTAGNDKKMFQWYEVFGVWKLFAVYFVIFLIHNFLLAPLLFRKHRPGLYTLGTTVLVTLFVLFQYTSRPDPKMMMHGPRPPMEWDGRKGPQEQKDRPGGTDTACRQPGVDVRYAHRTRHDSTAACETGTPGKAARPDKAGNDRRMPPLANGQANIFNTLMIIFLLCMNLGMKTYFKSEEDREEMQQLERQNLQHQLDYLKFQVNPHFFMNTLNNIHALIDIDGEKAKSSIVELSKLMRYLLYECNRSFVPLKAELDFLDHYITLMRMRFTDAVKIMSDIPRLVPDRLLPPLLLITFLENAFKHGVSYQSDSFIRFTLNIEDDRLHFECLNSMNKESTQEQGGIGLANVRQRLELIYGNDYELAFGEIEGNYRVSLDIPLLTEQEGRKLTAADKTTSKQRRSRTDD